MDHSLSNFRFPLDSLDSLPFLIINPAKFQNTPQKVFLLVRIFELICPEFQSVLKQELKDKFLIGSIPDSDESMY